MSFGSATAAHGRSAALPAAPQVTVGADIRQLRFDWSRTPRAQFYKLLKNPDGHSGFTQVGRRIPASKTAAVDNIAVHLHDWEDARYIVAACNASGCTNSAEISTTDVMLEAIGYLKSGQPKFGDFFGQELALSANGRTLAVASRDPEGPRAPGAVWIFRRGSNGTWAQEEFPFLQVRQTDSSFGFSLRLSADGNTLAVGAPFFNVPGGPTETFCDEGGNCTEIGHHGAVHIFHRSDGSWVQQDILHAPQLLSSQRFGIGLSLSDDGKTLAVGAFDGLNSLSQLKTATYVLRKSKSGWRHIAAFRPEREIDACFDPALSADGDALFVGCRFNDPDTGFPTGRQEIQVRVRSGSDWPVVSTLPYAVHPTDFFDFAYSVDRTGTMLAVREWVIDTAVASIYTRANVTSNPWTLQARVNGTSPSERFPGFGRDLSLSADGATLIVGDFAESSAGAGVLKAPGPLGPRTGAAYVFRRSDEVWGLKSLLKATNPDDGDSFGLHVAVSGTGRTVAVGAHVESSAASGINGDQTDNSLSAAGAVYLY